MSSLLIRLHHTVIMPSAAQAILIVGGGQGIGLETTRSILATSSATTKILVFGLHADSELAWISGQHPGRVWIILGDVTSAADRLRAVETCVKELGGLDTLVYCAGVITPIERIENVDIEAVKRTFDVNVFGAMAMVRPLPSHPCLAE
jgi:NAD(P)-dependent dehydrogenase (short-subunit alcohol dehydrogenase family)